MNSFKVMLKANMKLLLRNPGYLAFLIILPACAVLLLNLSNENTTIYNQEEKQVMVLYDENIRIQNMEGFELGIVVYDYANTPLSESFLEVLQKSGGYQVYRFPKSAADAEMLQDGRLEQKAIQTMNENTVGAFLVVEPRFDQLVQEGNYKECFRLYYGHEDPRVDVLRDGINGQLDSMRLFGAAVGEEAPFQDYLLGKAEKYPRIRSEAVGSKGNMDLTTRQSWMVMNVKFSWGVITMAFLFSGVFISNVVITERGNGVLKRTKLSGVNMTSYGLVKFLLILVTVSIQIFIMGIGIKFFVKVDFGIHMWQYLLITFGLALTLNTISVVTGILANNLLSTSYTVFFIATIMSLMSGLYFSGDIKGWIGRGAMLMPQYWGVKAVENLMTGSGNVFGMYFLAMAGFLIVVLCVGVLGMNMSRKEE